MVSRDPTLTDGGYIHAPSRRVQALPPEGAVHRYILTSAQNNTHLFRQGWNNLLALKEHYGARLLVGSFTYDKSSIGAQGAKKGTSKASDRQKDWWDSELEPFLADESIELAPGLVWCGELQVLPTAVDPISGLESYTGRSSSIVPHTKFAVTSIASPKHSGTKFIYTTGTVTLRNYIQKKAGQKAEFHHGYGGLIVEVDSDGAWFVRQLNADSEGVIYDFDLKVDAGKVTSGHRPEALVWGDIHASQLEPTMRALMWGKGGILHTLDPRRQVLHDIFDFRARNHHEQKNFRKLYRKHVRGQLSILAEIAQGYQLLYTAKRAQCCTVIVASNHDEAFDRWLRDTDFRDDLGNAEIYLRANLALVEAEQRGEEDFSPTEWAFRNLYKPRLAGWVRFLRRDEPYIVCPDAGGGIELGMHGDQGNNGGRGSLKGFARSGRKSIVGHSHSAGLFEGAMQVGCSCELTQDWNKGLSSWSHTHALVYPNGKRTLFTIWNGKHRA